MNERRTATAGEAGRRMRLVIYSFGFKHGVPVDANLVWDVRFLPNPYWQRELRPLSGLQQEVFDYVVGSDQGKVFLELLKPLLRFLLEAGDSSGNIHCDWRWAVPAAGTGRWQSLRNSIVFVVSWIVN